MVFGDVFEKRGRVWKAFQGEKWDAVYVENITIKIDLVNPLNEEIGPWSLLDNSDVEIIVRVWRIWATYFVQ
jgi:hypothetical protein